MLKNDYYSSGSSTESSRAQTQTSHTGKVTFADWEQLYSYGQKSLEETRELRKAIGANGSIFEPLIRQIVEAELKKRIDELSATLTKPYISVSTAAYLYDVSAKTIRNKIKKGEIPAYNWLGRTLLKRSDLQAQLMEVGKKQNNSKKDQVEQLLVKHVVVT